MELDINKIANEKINSLLESGEIEKLIADGVESNVKKAITAATENYQWKRSIEENIGKVISEVASNVNFSAYANFLRDRMNEQIEMYVKNDMINLMRDSFEKTYFSMPEDIKLSDILNKYKEYIENRLDYDDKKEWGHIDFSFETEYSSFIKIKAGSPKDTRYERYDKGIELTLYKPRSEEKATISWIRFNGNDFKTCMDLGKLSEFEILMFNLMFTRKEIEVDIDEDFCFDVDFDEEEYD